MLLDKDTGATCADSNGGCEQNCTDIAGGTYVCHCNSGFNVNPHDKKSCLGKLYFHCKYCQINVYFLLTIISRLDAHYKIQAYPIIRGSPQLPETFSDKIKYILKDVLPNISLICLIIVRFSIQKPPFES